MVVMRATSHGAWRDAYLLHPEAFVIEKLGRRLISWHALVPWLACEVQSLPIGPFNPHNRNESGIHLATYRCVASVRLGSQKHEISIMQLWIKGYQPRSVHRGAGVCDAVMM